LPINSFSYKTCFSYTNVKQKCIKIQFLRIILNNSSSKINARKHQLLKQYFSYFSKRPVKCIIIITEYMIFPFHLLHIFMYSATFLCYDIFHWYNRNTNITNYPSIKSMFPEKSRRFKTNLSSMFSRFIGFVLDLYMCDISLHPDSDFHTGIGWKLTSNNILKT
jgi:hypothetical protein